MRIVLLVICFSIISYSKVDAQLKYLFAEDFTTIDSIGDVFEKFNFSISYENRLHNLKSVDGKQYYFQPESSTYYEIFEEKYLIISPMDSIIIKKSLSTAPFLYPRNKVFLFCIANLSSRKMYSINFAGKIIIENSYLSSSNAESFLLEKIDLKKRRVYIFNPKLNIRHQLEIKEEQKDAIL